MLYLIGVPGSGKSTVAKQLTDDLPFDVRKVPYVAWTHYSDDVCQLGYEREHFSGTDTLGLASQKHVINWLADECPYEFVLAEGDRLANQKFLDAMYDARWRVTVVRISCSAAQLEKRRKHRSKLVGKEQTETWLRGRTTKVERLYANLQVPRFTIDTSGFRLGSMTADSRLRKHPVVRALNNLERTL